MKVGIEDDVIGRSVFFEVNEKDVENVEDIGEYEGKIISVTVTGTYFIEDMNGNEWELADGEFSFVDEDEDSEGELKDQELEDELEEESENELVNELEENNTLSEEINIDEMDFVQLKAYIKENKISVPFFAYKKEETLRKAILNAIGIEEEPKKSESKKSKEKAVLPPRKPQPQVKKEPSTSRSSKTKKKTEKKEKTEKVRKLTKYDIIADMILLEKTQDDILGKLGSEFPNASEKENAFQLGRAVRFAKRLGIKVK